MSTARWARIGFALLAWLLAGLAIVQIYLAGLALFVPGSTFEMHRNFGYLIGIIALVQLVLALAGRLGGRMIGASALLLGLMALQSILVIMRNDQPTIAAIHPVNGFLIVLLSVWIAWRGLGFVRAPLPVEPAPASPVPAPTPAPRPTLDQQDEQEDRL